MKPLLLFIIFFSAGFASLAQNEPYLVKEFAQTTAGNLRVKIDGGSISVSSRSGNKVRVELYVRRGSKVITARDSEAKKNPGGF